MDRRQQMQTGHDQNDVWSIVSRWVGQLPSMVVSLRWFNLVLGLILLLLAVFASPEVPTGRSIEKMFGSGDPSVLSYEKIKEIFGDQETILIVYRDAKLFDPSGSGLDRLAELSRQVEAVEQVEEVLSLDRIEQALGIMDTLSNPLAAFSSTANRNTNGDRLRPILDPNNKLAISFLDTFDGWTHLREENLAVLVCLISSPVKQINPDQTRITVEKLRQLVVDLPEAHVVGEPVMVEDSLSYLLKDGLWLQYGAVALLGTVILIMLRTFKWLVVTACVVGWSNLVTRWILALLSFEQSMISSLLGSIIAVIGVATTIHLVVGYRVQRLSGDSRSQAMREAVIRLLPPIFWACMTEAAGFTALYMANVSAVRDFGLMMAIASLVTFASICLLTPGLILIGPRERSEASAVGQQWLERFLERVLGWVNLNPMGVSAVILALGAIASMGFFFMKVETDFTKNFRENTPIMAGYRFVENEFGGAGLIDIAIKTPKALDSKFIAKVAAFEQQLRSMHVRTDGSIELAEEIAKLENDDSKSETSNNGSAKSTASDLPAKRPALAKVVSLVDAISAARVLPAVKMLPADTIVSGMRQVLPGFTNHWYHWNAQQQFGYVRVFARTRQQQSAETKREIIGTINLLAANSFGSDAVVVSDDPAEASDENKLGTPLSPDSATINGKSSDQPAYLVSGMFVLLTRLVDSLLADNLTTTITATAAIGLLLLLAFGEWRIALIALVPNVLPILVLLGMLGWSGIPINMGVAMIAAVSIGLSVDSSIHYLWSVTKARNDAEAEGSQVEKSIQTAQTRIGTALTYSSITLMVGFLSLTTSEFVPTVYFGGLVSAAMLGGLLGNLVLLPAMLRVANR